MVLAAGLIVAMGVVAFAINVSPSLLNDLRHGRNAEVASRSPFETEIYGLKIFQLFVPRGSVFNLPYQPFPEAPPRGAGYTNPSGPSWSQSLPR